MDNTIPENFKYQFLQNIHSQQFQYLINNFDLDFKLTLNQLLNFCKLDK